MLFGDFNGDGKDDVLQHGVRASVPQPACWALHSPDPRLVSLDRFRLSSAGAQPFGIWSTAEMR
jgi:hypothetical protein